VNYSQSIRAVPDLFSYNPTGAVFCGIWNDRSGRSCFSKL